MLHEKSAGSKIKIIITSINLPYKQQTSFCLFPRKYSKLATLQEEGGIRSTSSVMIVVQQQQIIVDSHLVEHTQFTRSFPW